jgi:hypothetical protein
MIIIFTNDGCLVYLHNELLLAILFNSLLEASPTSHVNGQKRKLDQMTTTPNTVSPTLSRAQEKERMLLQAIRSLSKADRERMRQALKNPVSQINLLINLHIYT